jgi:hypothetical protein
MARPWVLSEDVVMNESIDHINSERGILDESAIGRHGGPARVAGAKRCELGGGAATCSIIGERV